VAAYILFSLYAGMPCLVDKWGAAAVRVVRRRRERKFIVAVLGDGCWLSECVLF